MKFAIPSSLLSKAIRVIAAVFVPLFFLNAGNCRGNPGEAGSVTQYGMTWTFDKPHAVGQFVNGDWWVVGPVTVTSVTPAPGSAPAGEPSTQAQSRYGATALTDDKRLRNGSMIVAGPGNTGNFAMQGYDSRGLNFDPALSVAYPCRLTAGQSLISTASSETYENGKLSTPYIPGILFPDSLSQPSMPLALESAAVLTCVDQIPDADAFRPPYAGTWKPLYRLRDVRWDLLPKLAPTPSTPDWQKMARIYQRPWLDHMADWNVQNMSPGQNQAAYGGVVSRMNALASLMLIQDIPREQKEPLMIGFLQYGIDLAGLAHSGRQWASDGGHWMGRKWPILFASMVLGQPDLRAFPAIDPSRPILYKKIKLTSASGAPVPSTLFSEDMDTYYGKGAFGQDVLWQVGFHTHARQPYMENPYASWSEDDKFVNTYFWIGGNWPAFALAALHMKARPLWDHDAFFDYCDWLMQPGHLKIYSNDGHTGPARNNTEKFIQEMWDAYRTKAPAQPGGTHQRKWVWNNGKMNGTHFYSQEGAWEENPKTGDPIESRMSSGK